MQIPLQITFHGLDPSAALEEEIRTRAKDLESVFERIVSCRVSVEASHRQHREGGPFRVHVDVGIPGKHVVIDRATDEAVSHADPYLAVRDAFRAAKRRLEDHVHRRRAFAQRAA
jgi:ribosome-associated translation inhibitor RaiA